jgi:hypothetical protein
MVKVIYSGGVQIWQNVEDMLKLAQKSETFANYTFLSNDFEWIQKRGEALNLKNACYKKAHKVELKNIYKEMDFGLVLRNDSPVNFVSCPTKLYEYMACGVIPIVRTVSMGDFEELKFAYVKEEDFAKGFVPDNEQREGMILNNFEVVKKMRERFNEGKNKLVEVLDNRYIVAKKR